MPVNLALLMYTYKTGVLQAFLRFTEDESEV